jgi:hypothetical protein
VHVLRPDALRSYAAGGRKSEACASPHWPLAAALRPFSP